MTAQKPDVIVYSLSGYLIGYPPKVPNVRMIFDYSDYLDKATLRPYLSLADSTVASSRSLQNQVKEMGVNAEYIPNGAPLREISAASETEVLDVYGLRGVPVIGWIGLTGEPSLYVIDAFERFRETRPDAKLLIVGDSPIIRRIKKKSRRMRNNIQLTGFVPPPLVYSFVKACDAGVYPGSDTPYYRSACPMKILEFTAAKRPVVSSPVDEIDALQLTNVLQVGPDAESFAAGLEAALDRPPSAPPIDSLDWRLLASQFERAL
jgi:glycosyltransferase involved in cell wall biosynthesis